MARIIEEGYMPMPEYHLVCKHCGTLASYHEFEMRFFEGCYDEELVSYDCPHCYQSNTILVNDLPKPVKVEEIKEVVKEEEKSGNNFIGLISGLWRKRK